MRSLADSGFARLGRALSASLLGVFALLAGVTDARAQNEPDIRAFPPFVMILADTSGSMEWKPGCICDTTGCSECLPDCALPNDALNEPPPGKKNRWSVLLEALTGKFTNFNCLSLERTAANGMTYDLDYSKPYNRPWLCPNGQTLCSYPGTTTSPIQIENGLLDNYAERIRFGLATFDGMRTYAGKGDLVAAAEFNQTLSQTASGSFSYAGSKRVHYPTCTTDYLIDSGIRGRNAPEGGLISLDSVNSCASPPCDMAEINAQIQSTLLNTRTFGGTPTASALDDLYYHFKYDLTDSLSACRERYAVLITDGYPDDDFRDYPVPGCDCKARGNCRPEDNPNDMHCPYPTATQAAYDLVNGRNGDEPQMSQLFVVGMSIADATSRAGLNAIASYGGSIDTDKDGNEAFFADNPATLTATLDTVLGNLTKPISRSVPAFVTGLGGAQYQVSAGFKISSETPPIGYTTPWQGILERRRFECNGAGVLTTPTLVDDDRFEVALNKQTIRSLWTALPTVPTEAKVNGPLDASLTSCGLIGCNRTELTLVPSTLYKTTDLLARTTLVDWMYGNAGSLREKKKLGDIYHSSVAVVGRPVDDPGDQSYTLFRESTKISERPVVMYVNSNDGILHAVSVENYPPPGSDIVPTYHPGLTLKAGQELWGFVPPMLLGQLKDQLSAHKLNLDGTPVVKDVYFSKGSTSPKADDYKTVLVTGMRSGGKGYVALDVTDPVAPKFLWQFNDPAMGYTYGQPEIVQAMYEWPAGQPASLRAMAILPGGKGIPNTNPASSPGCNGLSTPAMYVPNSAKTLYTSTDDPDANTGAKTLRHRAEVRCWEAQGRSLFFVDVETGQLIKKIHSYGSGVLFPSPLIGSPTAYQDAVGTVATEGFVVDADGVVWRIDLAATNPQPTNPTEGWTVRPFHDLFWDRGPSEGETTYERPILSLDESRRVVVIVGTGDTDNFEKSTIENRVVSMTEIAQTGANKPADYSAAVNWELRVDGSDKSFVPSEMVTGQMSLFQGQLYLASFISVSDTSDLCARGRGRLWSVDYRKRDLARANPSSGSSTSGGVVTYSPLRLDVASPDTSGSNADIGLFNITKGAAEPNLLVQGLGTTQRATCNSALPDDTGNYFARIRLPIIQQSAPSIWIVAQASSNNRTRQRAGSQLGTLQVQLTRPMAFSTLASWAGSIE
ncbi:MAG: PilC/PilY family type IV pilus protein [Polyangiales bacterium]